MRTRVGVRVVHLTSAAWLMTSSLLGLTGCEGGGKDVVVEIPDDAAPENATTPEEMASKFEFD